MWPSEIFLDSGVCSADHAGPRLSSTNVYIRIANFFAGAQLALGLGATGGGVQATSVSASMIRNIARLHTRAGCDVNATALRAGP